MNRSPVLKRVGAQLLRIKVTAPDGSKRSVEEAFKLGASFKWWGEVEYIGAGSGWYLFQRLAS